MELICGDCLEQMQRMRDGSVDMVMTSPPYDDMRTYNGYQFDWKATIRELWRVIKPGGVVVWVVSDQTKNGSETGTSFRQALYAMECGFNLHDTMIWEKTSFSFPHAGRYFGVFDYMFVFSKGKPHAAHLINDRKNKYAGCPAHGTSRQIDGSLTPSNGIKAGRKVQQMGIRFNVWNISAEKNNKTGHPAVFPVALARDHIMTWSDPGDTVLDCFMGSGTTGIACAETGRHFIGIEIDPTYFSIAKERIEAETAQMRMEVDAW